MLEPQLGLRKRVSRSETSTRAGWRLRLRRVEPCSLACQQALGSSALCAWSVRICLDLGDVELEQCLDPSCHWWSFLFSSYDPAPLARLYVCDSSRPSRVGARRKQVGTNGEERARGRLCPRTQAGIYQDQKVRSARRTTPGQGSTSFCRKRRNRWSCQPLCTSMSAQCTSTDTHREGSLPSSSNSLIKRYSKACITNTLA